MKEAYEDVFHISEVPTPADGPAVEGLFKSKPNSTDKLSQLQAMTFYTLLKNADFKATPSKASAVPPNGQREDRHADKSAVVDNAVWRRRQGR
jgi:hypothetical protein